MYLNGFSDKEAIANEFKIELHELEGCDIVFAAYTYEDYSGSALVLYMKDGKMYEVNGGHCSCYGLEGQWKPEETFLEALRMRDVKSYGFEEKLEDLFVNLVFERDVLQN